METRKVRPLSHNALLKRDEVAKILGISMSKLHDMVSKKQLPQPLKNGRTPLWRAEDFLTFLAELTSIPVSKLLECPDLMDINEVESLSRCKKSKLYELMSQKQFPKPIKFFSRASRWHRSQIDEWLGTLTQSA